MVGTSNFERLKSQYMPFDLLYFHKDMQLLGPNLLKWLAHKVLANLVRPKLD
jgi:hypothetical protein